MRRLAAVAKLPTARKRLLSLLFPFLARPARGILARDSHYHTRNRMERRRTPSYNSHDDLSDDWGEADNMSRIASRKSRTIFRTEPTWEIAHLFPDQGTWTEGEYLALDTNHLIELSNGRLEVLPM